MGSLHGERAVSTGFGQVRDLGFPSSGVLVVERGPLALATRSPWSPQFIWGNRLLGALRGLWTEYSKKVNRRIVCLKGLH